MTINGSIHSLTSADADLGVGAFAGYPPFFMGEALKTGGSSQTQRIRSAVTALVEPLIAPEGYELIEAEYVVDRGRNVLRLFIDTVPPGTEEKGVTIDDCTHVSRLVSDVLDVEEVVPGAYSLEVSSPGMFRPLTKPEHYERAVGERIKVKTYEKIDGRKTFTGRLEGREAAEVIVVTEDGNRFRIPDAAIAKANLEPLI